MKFLSKFDIFGLKVNFTFERRVNYNTICGGVFSLILVIITLVFGVSSLVRVASRDVLSFSTDYSGFNWKKGFNAGQYGFNMKFGFVESNQSLDPRIGKWRAFYQNSTVSGE
jgi:hypothetical protein